MIRNIIFLLVNTITAFLLRPEWRLIVLSALIGYLGLSLGSLPPGRVEVTVTGGLMGDSIGRVLALITLLIILGCMVATFKAEFFQVSYFARFRLLTLRSLLVFSTSRIICFYVAFELRLIPITLIVMG